MPEFVQLRPNIYRLRVPFSGTWTGVILVLGPENALIDSGAKAADVDEWIVPALQKMGLSLDQITYLACTHTHGDHVSPMDAGDHDGLLNGRQDVLEHNFLRTVCPSGHVRLSNEVPRCADDPSFDVGTAHIHADVPLFVLFFCHFANLPFERERLAFDIVGAVKKR